MPSDTVNIHIRPSVQIVAGVRRCQVQHLAILRLGPSTGREFLPKRIPSTVDAASTGAATSSRPRPDGHRSSRMRPCGSWMSQGCLHLNGPCRVTTLAGRRQNQRGIHIAVGWSACSILNDRTGGFHKRGRMRKTSVGSSTSKWYGATVGGDIACHDGDGTDCSAR